MTGPTTTGSIDAKLTIDKSNWDRGRDEAKAEAAELGELSPTVKVDANVGPALAKLEAVAAAERDLDHAYQRSAISQAKLSQVTEKYGEDSVQAAQARLTHSKSIAAEEAAESKLSRAKQGATVDEDRNTEAVRRGTQANAQHVSGLQVLIGLAPAILAAAAPVAGAAVGLGVAFGVMAVSGVLAIKGIKDEMQSGSTVGNQYAAGIGVLKGNLDQLSGVAAVGMLDSFNSSVGDINSRMPFLNQMIREGSGLLGQMGGTAISGVLTALQQMNPLIQQGGVELGRFVAWLFSFNGTDGFRDFLAYASANLPSVMHLIESLVTTSGHLLSAFAPLGPVVIQVLTALSDGLSSLPLPVLAGLVTTATTLGPALRMAFSTAPLILSVAEAIGLTGVMAQLAVPGIGILLAAIAGLGMAAATSAVAQDHGTASMQNYTQALRDDTNAIGEHVKAQAAKALVDSGATAAARTLGVSIADVTAAATGNSDALARVTTVTDAASKAAMGGVAGHRTATEAQIKSGDAAKILTDAVGGTNSAINDGIQKNKDYDAALAASKTGMELNTGAAQLQASQFGATVQAYQGVSSAQADAATKLAETTLSMQLQNDAAGLLKQALDGLNGKAISAAQAQNTFDSQLTNMATHVDAAGHKIVFTTATLGDMSTASVAVRGQLNGQVQALQAVVEANGGLENSTGAARDQMVKMRQQIIDNAVAHGVDRDAVTAYIDKIMQIPASVPPTKVDVDDAAARLKLQGFQQAINSLTGKTVDIYSVTHIQEVRDGPAVNGISGNAIANSMDAANAYATGSAYRSEGGAIYRSGGGPVNYLASGGTPFPGSPRGTDIVPTWLTPGEEVINRSSADSLRRNSPGALEYMNQTGQLPASQQGGGGSVTVQLVLDGQVLDTRTVSIVDGKINDLSRDLSGQRRS